MLTKTKIVLDADVIIHFIEAERFSLIFNIFPEYEYLILDIVYNELAKSRNTKNQLDNTLNLFAKRFSKIAFSPKGESRREFARLTSPMGLALGLGESACMVYCRDNSDVLGSSNLKDIKEYCLEYQIPYLTTLDFLYYAYIRHLITKEECEEFIASVRKCGSKLPLTDITRYTCQVGL